MILSINQPAFFPWMGYFHRIAISDLHVVLDHVQFEKNSFTNRNKIKTNSGSTWLTVPLSTSGKFGDLSIASIEIAPQVKWQKKTIETIRQFYRKTPYFDQYFPFIEATLEKAGVSFNGLLKELNTYFLEALHIKTPLVYSSEIDIEGAKSELVFNICKKYGATVYISGPFGKDYLDTALFSDNGIEVVFHEYQHPEYTQAYPDFTSHLSIIDLLFNHGENSREILMSAS